MAIPKYLCKHFNDVFLTENTTLGIQIIAKIKVEIGENFFDKNKAIINYPDLQTLSDKYFIGWWLEELETFRVEAYFDGLPKS